MLWVEVCGFKPFYTNKVSTENCAPTLLCTLHLDSGGLCNIATVGNALCLRVRCQVPCFLRLFQPSQDSLFQLETSSHFFFFLFPMPSTTFHPLDSSFFKSNAYPIIMLLCLLLNFQLFSNRN